MIPETLRIAFWHMPKRYGVYRLVNTITGESYIGATSCMQKRARQHSDQLRLGTHDNAKLLASYREHGIAAFKFEVIEQCHPARLDDRERHYIGTLKPAFNTSPGYKPKQRLPGEKIKSVIPLPQDMYARIKREAIDDSRTFPQMARMLLREAIAARDLAQTRRAEKEQAVAAVKAGAHPAAELEAATA